MITASVCVIYAESPCAKSACAEPSCNMSPSRRLCGFGRAAVRKMGQPPQPSRSAAGGRLARRAPRSGGRLRGGGPCRRLAVELFLLGLDELAIVRRIEVEQRPARGEMLNESLADRVGGAGREHRHRERGDR